MDRRHAPTAAREAYLGLHRGKAPRGVSAVKMRSPKWLAAYGRLTSFEAERDEPDGTHLFRHEFEPHARPVWAFDETGQMHVVGGRYTVTDHGVEDTGTRDPARNTERGMRHTYSVPLVNPSRSPVPAGLRAFAADAGVIGVTAGAYVASIDYLLDQTSLGVGAKTVLAAVGGVVAGAALYNAKAAPRVAVGLAAGGLVAAVVGTINYVRTQAYLRSLGVGGTQAASTPAPAPQAAAPEPLASQVAAPPSAAFGLPSPTPPVASAGVFIPPAVAGALPRGAPVGYSLTTLDGCAAGGAGR